MTSRLHHLRTSAGLIVAVASSTFSGTSLFGPQQPELGPGIPGLYLARQCGPAPFPIQLPPLDSVLDTAVLVPALQSIGVNKRLLLGVRLGAVEATLRVRVIEKKVSGEVAERAVAEVEATIRPVPADRDWAFRIMVQGGAHPIITLERSRICAAIPAPQNSPMTAIAVVPSTDLDRLRSEAQQTASRLRSMRHRVLVDESGRVLAVELTNSSGDPQMDEVHAMALKRRSFLPTKLDGVAVTAWVEVRGDYDLATH
jgi:hypothetical protein